MTEMRRTFSGLAANLRASVPLLLFRRPKMERMRVDIDQLLLLVVLNALLSFGVSYAQNLPHPEFSYFGLYSTTFELASLLLVAYLLAKLGREPRVNLRFLILAYSLSACLYLVGTVIYLPWDTERWPSWLVGGSYYALLGWALLAMAVLVLHVLDKRWRWVVPGLAAYVALNFVPSYYLAQGQYWYPHYEESDRYAAYRKINEEDVYYAQRELLRKSAGRVAAGEPGVTEMYFVGFAGYANEDVFMKEIGYAEHVLDRAYGVGSRTMTLINHLSTIGSAPLANAHNLKAALRAVGERMNRDEDVLFLYLTSHGSKTDGLAVRFWPFGFNDIRPEELREALDAAGIRWRVLLVSSCYSGIFVDALKDEDTLVMTASASDRRSFGCGATSDFTYFGKAVFEEQFPKVPPLLDALEGARVSIREREKREGKEASMPQLFVGENIRGKLKELDAGREQARGRTASAVR